MRITIGSWQTLVKPNFNCIIVTHLYKEILAAQECFSDLNYDYKD